MVRDLPLNRFFLVRNVQMLECQFVFKSTGENRCGISLVNNYLSVFVYVLHEVSVY